MKISEVIKSLPASNAAIKNTASSEPKEGWYPAYSASGQDVWLPDCRFTQKGIVVSAVGARCGKAFKADGKWNICANTHPLSVDETKALRDYCWYMINNEDWWIKGGTAQPFVKVKDSFNRDFNFPPISEQKLIVHRLDTIQSLINQKQLQIERLDELVKARFVEMFGGSKTYPIRPLSDIAEYWNGLTYKPTDVSNDGTIVLRSSNIQNMQLDLNDIVRVKCDIGNKKIVEKNDILMCSRNGSAKLVGKVALIPNLQEQMSFGAFMMIIRSEYYSYLMTYFQLPEFRSQISTGTTTINQITRYMLDKVELPVPDKASIDEFSTFVAQIDKSKFALGNELAMGDFYVRLIHNRIMHGRIDL